MNINCKEFGRLTGVKYDKMFEQSKRIYSTDGLSPTIHTMQGGNTEVKVAILKQNVSDDTSKPRALGHFNYPNSNKAHQSSVFYDKNAVSPTLDTCGGGNTQVKILVDTDKLPLALDEQNKYIRTDGTVGTIMTNGSSPKHNNRVIEFDNRIKEINAGARHQQDLLQSENGICRTIPAGTHGSTPHLLKTVLNNHRIRKLTPKECWRLMGFSDEDFEKAEKVCSNTQLYKQAGNSIVVNVLEGILGALLPKPSRSEWLDELLGG